MFSDYLWYNYSGFTVCFYIKSMEQWKGKYDNLVSFGDNNRVHFSNSGNSRALQYIIEHTTHECTHPSLIYNWFNIYLQDTYIVNINILPCRYLMQIHMNFPNMKFCRIKGIVLKGIHNMAINKSLIARLSKNTLVTVLIRLFCTSVIITKMFPTTERKNIRKYRGIRTFHSRVSSGTSYGTIQSKLLASHVIFNVTTVSFRIMFVEELNNFNILNWTVLYTLFVFKLQSRIKWKMRLFTVIDKSLLMKCIISVR